MINKKYLKNLRSKENIKKNDFIYDLYNERIIDSLNIISLNFKNILILGDNGRKIDEYLQNKYKSSLITLCDFKKNKLNKKNFINLKNTELDLNLFEKKIGTYDLIISNCFLNLFEPIENIFKKIILLMKPNGFFISTLPSPNNLNNLKSYMINTDLLLYHGVYNRFNKSIELHQLINLLKINNFKIPLVNVEKIKLEYKNFYKMLIDIRSMNLSYFYQDKKKYFEKKEYFKILEENYKKNKKNNFELLTEFFIVSGWKHHISQQTPLMPGEAKNNLGDFLK